MNDLLQRLSITYIKLRFTVTFQEDAIVPVEKVSALRGGMGEMFLRQNCIKDRDCPSCAYQSACIVHKTFYTEMKRRPPFMHGMDSAGYLIECENYQMNFKKGEGFFFYLTLFGNNIVYFGQYLQAFYQLGASGIGVHKAHFFISGIRNMAGETLMNGYEVYMEKYRPETVCDYVMRRAGKLEKSGYSGRIDFHTPVCLKHQGKFLDEFCSEAFFQAIFRRIMILDYFTENYVDMPVKERYPELKEQYPSFRSVKRYSTAKEEKMRLHGISGNFCFADIDEDELLYILAGELLHIGKNTSFGFGRYTFS